MTAVERKKNSRSAIAVAKPGTDATPVSAVVTATTMLRIMRQLPCRLDERLDSNIEMLCWGNVLEQRSVELSFLR